MIDDTRLQDDAEDELEVEEKEEEEAEGVADEEV